MEMPLGTFNPEADLAKAREARIEAKVQGIKDNPDESRSDEEIRAQAIAELEAEENGR